MAKARSIDPFPPDINREHFGHYLAGFTDGEACFGLNIHTYNYSSVVRPCAAFTINLRADDCDILRLIQSFFGCGILTSGRGMAKNGGYISREQYVFKITSIVQLASIVIPHFIAFPLRAKKSRDFVIWREGVEFIHEVITSRRVGKPGHNEPQRWTPERFKHYLGIRARLKQQRQFEPVSLPESPPPERTLFDSL